MVMPVSSLTFLAMSADWQRPPRQMIGTAYWYLATDQWRYDTFGADTFASPAGQDRFTGLTTADLIAMSARLGWMPSYPTFNWNPLDLADALERSGTEPGAFVAGELAAGRSANLPPRAQQLEQHRREHRVAVLATLALLDPDQHALAVNV